MSLCTCHENLRASHFLGAFLVATLFVNSVAYCANAPQAPIPSATTLQTTPGFTLPPAIPTGKTARQISIAGFHFEGNTVISNESLQKVVESYIGQSIALTELEDIRNRLTRLYIDNGYINSGALLASMPDENGYPGNIVPIKIVEGRVQSFNIKGEAGLQKSFVYDRLVHADEVLNMVVLQERFRQLLLDPLFEKVNSRIIPGDTLGQAVLDVEIVRARPYSLSLFANNYRAPSIGSESIGVSATLHNLTGYGDKFDANFSHSRGASPLHLGWAIPLSADGTILRTSIDHGQSSVIEESLRSIDIKSTSSGAEIGLARPLVNTLKRKIELGLSYGARESETTLLGEAFSFTPGEPDGISQIRLLRFSQDWTERWEQQALAMRSIFAFGRNNIVEADSPVAVANKKYQIWSGQIQYVSNVPRNVFKNVFTNDAQILLRGAAQYSADRLLPLERFSLGGIGTVRGYRENVLVRDQGFVTNLELHYPLMNSNNEKQKLNLVTFLDYAKAKNKDEASQKLSSLGIGLEWQLDKLKVEFAIAKKLCKLPVETRGNLQDHGIHFQISYKQF